MVLRIIPPTHSNGLFTDGGRPVTPPAYRHYYYYYYITLYLFNTELHRTNLAEVVLTIPPPLHERLVLACSRRCITLR